MSHPLAIDLSCPAEPRAPDDAAIAAALAAGTLDQLDAAFNTDALLAGRACRDALGRVRAWHIERGLKP